MFVNGFSRIAREDSISGKGTYLRMEYVAQKLFYCTVPFEHFFDLCPYALSSCCYYVLNNVSWL
jgi:hypothetical protein